MGAEVCLNVYGNVHAQRIDEEVADADDVKSSSDTGQ